jgi:hypothetical protein
MDAASAVLHAPMDTLTLEFHALSQPHRLFMAEELGTRLIARKEVTSTPRLKGWIIHLARQYGH